MAKTQFSRNPGNINGVKCVQKKPEFNGTGTRDYLFIITFSGGYLTVQEPPWRTPLATAYVEAGVEMGFENR